MPLTDPVVITGQIRGAYREEQGFAIQGEDRLYSLTEIIQFLLGGGAGDGNGIYSGSGIIPNGTVATASGSFKIASTGTILIGDETNPNQRYFAISGIAGQAVALRNSDTTSGEECDLQILPQGFFVETDDANTDGVTQINTSKDEIQLSANNEAGGVVTLRISSKTVRITGVPNYANDAAATSDAALLSGGLYTTTDGGRSLKIKA